MISNEKGNSIYLRLHRPYIGLIMTLALRARFFTLKNLSAPRKRVSVIALRAPKYVDLALCARSSMPFTYKPINLFPAFFIFRVEFCLERGFSIFNNIFR